MDKKALLDELKIDRSTDAIDSYRPVKWFLAIAILGGVGFVGWYLEFPASIQPLEVRTILARAPSAVSDDNIVLDATGYVIARRQATVSSKVTGETLMPHFIAGEDRTQTTLFPASFDDYISDNNPVRMVDYFVDDLRNSRSIGR